MAKSKYYYDFTRNIDESKEVIQDLKSNPIPNYYVGNTYGYEARKVCEDWDLSYNIATAVTYLLRSSYKHDSPYDDIQKAINHLNFELDIIHVHLNHLYIYVLISFRNNDFLELK